MVIKTEMNCNRNGHKRYKRWSNLWHYKAPYRQQQLCVKRLTVRITSAAVGWYAGRQTGDVMAQPTT